MIPLNFTDSAQYVDLTDQVTMAKKNKYDCLNLHRQFISTDGFTIADPEIELARYIPFIEQYCKTLNVENSTYFDYRPDYLSKSLYDTHDLWYLLLMINNCQHRFQFKGPEFIVIPSKDLIYVKDFISLCTTSVSKSQIINEGDLTIKELNVY